MLFTMYFGIIQTIAVKYQIFGQITNKENS